MGIGTRFSSAQDAKAPDLSELRDAIKAAGKRGDNVDEVRKAVDVLEKFLAKGWTPPVGGRAVAAPPELVAVRESVEAASKKGENVEEIRKQLELVEKTMTGNVLARPKPLPPPDEPVRPNPRNPDFPGFPGLPAFPNFPQGGGVDPELLQKAMDLRMKAMEMMLKAPNDADATKLLQEAQDLLFKAMAGRGGIGGGLGGGFVMPGFPAPDMGRVNERFRLGIRMEKITAVMAEQLGLDGQGVVIAAVMPNSAAEKAGFKANDIVLEFAGKAVTDLTEDFTRQVNDAKAGEKFNAVVLRKGKKVELKGIELPDMARPMLRVPEGRALPMQPNIVPLPLPNVLPLVPMLPNLKPLPFPNVLPVPNIQ